MKRALVTLATTLICMMSYAQNYQCLQAGVKRYFINGNGYLRGMYIDSIRTIGGTTFYYPFHTPRGGYDAGGMGGMPTLDPNGGSWLGKSVMQQSDGTIIFDSYWGDSVIIKTQANTGDSWVFYSDSSELYYLATMTGKDTMSVAGAPDSVKKIMINAYNSGGIAATDPLDSFTILLSKNHGFVQVFDLYTFPYHEPDSIFRTGLDFYLDRSLCDYNNINAATTAVAPSKHVSIFRVTNFIVPNEQQLYDWHVGDIIQFNHSFGLSPFSVYGMANITDTVTQRTVSSHVINYTVSGQHYLCTYGEPCMLLCNSGSYSFSDNSYPITDTGYIPEQFQYDAYLFYYPNDTRFCMNTPAYTVVPAHYNFPISFDFSYGYTSYKLGLGKTSAYHFDDDPMYEMNQLFYSKINGTDCGTHLPSSVRNINHVLNVVNIYPNPSDGVITVTSDYGASYSITLMNVMGQTIKTILINKAEEIINLSDIPDGVYSVMAGGKYIQKIMILHQ